MPIDMRRPMIAAIQAALDEVQAEPSKKKRHGVGAGRALLLGAGLYTAGRVVARGRGRGLIDAIEQRLPHQQDGSGDDEPEDDASDEDFDEDDDFDEDEPEDEADQEPADELDQEPDDEAGEDAPEPEEDDEEPAPKAEGDEAEPEDEAPGDVDEKPEDEAEPETPKPKRGSRGRATRSRK